MAIGPIEYNGIIGRSQDIGTIKHHEDAKSVIDQSNLHNKFDQKLEQNLNKVQKSESSELAEQKFDAKEKGSNQFFDNREKNNKKKQQKPDGDFKVKNSGGFDVKI